MYNRALAPSLAMSIYSYHNHRRSKRSIRLSKRKANSSLLGNIGLQSLNYISYYPETTYPPSRLFNFNLPTVYTSELFCQAVLTFLCFK